MSKLAFSIFEMFKSWFQGVGNALSLDILFYVLVGVEVFFVIFYSIKSHFAYEFRLIRSLDKLNVYLLNNAHVDENNLIEFNKKMKKVPKILRYHWQQYMLYREQSPSYYMSTDNCIERAIKSSSLTSNIKTSTNISCILAILAVVFTIFQPTLSSVSFSTILTTALVIPAVVIVLNMFYVIFQRLSQNSNLSNLYHTFHIYQRLIDKAATTIPEYVDFEVLFTKQEIKKGIPVLNEYLEKRARQEQEELEKARLNAVEHEVYDFSGVDINGSLILERSLKETEIYLNIRQRLMGEIQQIESEIESLKKTYENTQKDYQRKLQASKENVERLRAQQEATTNRIESNYIRKQQGDEVKKQQQIEKDNDDSTLRFNQEISTLTIEIQKRKEDLEEHRKYIEKAMLAEYQTYSTKVYKNLSKLADENEKDEKEKIITSRDTYAQELEDAKDQLSLLQQENDELKAKIKTFSSELEEKDQYYTNVLIETAEKAKSAVGKKDSKNKVIEEQPQVVEETKVPEAEPVYDEYGGYYDSEGYYRYQNGTYYDPQGNYYDENGGWYDPQGNYHAPENAVVEQPEKVLVDEEVVAEPNTVENVIEEPVEEQEIEEEPVEEETPKKKPGRPRKEKSPEEENKPKGKPGRPRKEKSPEEENKPKGKPGRPKKEKTLVKKTSSTETKQKKDDLIGIQEEIDNESKKLSDQQKELDEHINEALEEITQAETEESFEVKSLKSTIEQAEKFLEEAKEKGDEENIKIIENDLVALKENLKKLQG